jgi:hypothetical protein
MRVAAVVWAGKKEVEVMKPILMRVLMVSFLLGTWHLAEALEPLKPYDTFEVGPISPDRWIGESFGPDLSSSASILYEGNRTIVLDPSGVGRDLRILNRSYGLTDSDSGLSLGIYGLNFKNPSTVTAIRARVQVLNVLSKGCVSNAAPTSAQARLVGFFFNASAPTSGAIDDVIAGISVARRSNSTDPPNVFEVFSFVVRCTDFDCIDGISLGGGLLGKVTAGQWVRLLMQWDQVNHQFIFQRDARTPLIVQYQVSDTTPPGLPLKGIGTINLVPNCTNPPRPFGSMNALFDNVAVNESAIP